MSAPRVGGIVGVVEGWGRVVMVMELMSEEAEKHCFFGAEIHRLMRTNI